MEFADSGENGRGRLSYAIASGDHHRQFTVGEADGRIVLSSSLDREMISSYVLEGEAADHGCPEARTASVLVSVEVSDANDKAPIFPKGNYTSYVQVGK